MPGSRRHPAGRRHSQNACLPQRVPGAIGIAEVGLVVLARLCLISFMRARRIRWRERCGSPLATVMLVIGDDVPNRSVLAHRVVLDSDPVKLDNTGSRPSGLRGREAGLPMRVWGVIVMPSG